MQERAEQAVLNLFRLAILASLSGLHRVVGKRHDGASSRITY